MALILSGCMAGLFRLCGRFSCMRGRMYQNRAKGVK
nr:MAG TPA: hypothetical protein [Caudoviricetes sp.]